MVTTNAPVTQEKMGTDKKDNPEIEDEQVEEASPELLEKIKTQIEFYFGDVSIGMDGFLQYYMKKDEGWIPMEIMLRFRMLASLSKDIPTMLKAVEDSDLIEISEDNSKIRRRLDKPPPLYDPTCLEELLPKRIYVSGFPPETDITQLKEFFKHQHIEYIKMKKYKDGDKIKRFTGLISVQFKTVGDANAFMIRESVEYNNQKLSKLFYKDYQELKSTLNPNSSIHIPKGSVLKFTGASSKTDWEGIKLSLNKLYVKTGKKSSKALSNKIQPFRSLRIKIAFIDHEYGSTNGYVRLQGINSAKTCLEMIPDHKITLDGCDIKFEVLEENEEKKYLDQVATVMTKRHSKQNQKKRHSRRANKRKKASNPTNNKENKKASSMPNSSEENPTTIAGMKRAGSSTNVLTSAKKIRHNS